MHFKTFCIALAFASSSLEYAQTTATLPNQPVSSAPMELQDDVSLDTYLDALSHLNPAAKEGAEAYLQAFQKRCGRPMKAIELRRRVVDGNGDPVLMGMIGAAAQHDAAAIQKLSASVRCAR